MAIGNFSKGNSSNNKIEGRNGNDTIDGGLGTDTVVYRDEISNYSITRNDDNSISVKHLTFSDNNIDDGTDILTISDNVPIWEVRNQEMKIMKKYTKKEKLLTKIMSALSSIYRHNRTLAKLS